MNSLKFDAEQCGKDIGCNYDGCEEIIEWANKNHIGCEHERERMIMAIEVMKDALEFYQTTSYYTDFWDVETETTKIEQDFGRTARSALEQASKILGEKP